MTGKTNRIKEKNNKAGGARNQIKALDRSASNNLDRPTPEMPGKHQPSAFSTKIFISKSIYKYAS